MPTDTSYQALRPRYTELFSTAVIRPEKLDFVNNDANRIVKKRELYERLEKVTGVPWYVIGCIHLLESNLNEHRHLHNGDPLTARTVHDPPNRPAKGSPPFSFEQSAVDALEYDQLTYWNDWSIEGTLYKLEAFNGPGYLKWHPEVNTPYLWSYTNHYTKGKYVADKKFDPNAVSQQVGVVAILLALKNLGVISFARGGLDFTGKDKTISVPYPGQVIQRGSPDMANVIRIQERLVATQCGPLEVDGSFGPGTESAVRYFQSRHSDVDGRPLTIDGRVGPRTWAALFGTSNIPTTEAHQISDALVKKALLVAESQEGIRETPPNSNRGPEVEAYQRSVDIGPPELWCAAFVYWCFQQAANELGTDNPLVRTGAVLKHWNDARKQGTRAITAQQAEQDISLVQPGQIFIMDHGHGRGHTGLVKQVRGDVLVTIEGNTNILGSDEGDGVYVRTRQLSDINAGFLDYAIRIKPIEETQAAPVASSSDLPSIAPLVATATSGGLLRKAVEMNAFEAPTWIELPFQGYIVRVGAHVLRAKIGDKLLRLPVSYKDVIAICRQLDWIAPTAALSDAIYQKATLHLRYVPRGKWNTPEDDAISSIKMKTLEYTISYEDKVETQIPIARRGELASTEGKDWILSNRILRKLNGAMTYGWHDLDNHGIPIQGPGEENDPPSHNDDHFDYSQTLRPIQRRARRISDGATVDLLEVLRKGLADKVIAPFLL